jgi:dTDP-4-amino-4,6-dideoxygalactose transaminase
MSEQPIFVTQPYLPPLEEYTEYLKEIWDNKVLTNGGRFHQRLEEGLCEYLGVKHISLFANATLALIVALEALDVRGDVITTPYSFVATAHSLLWHGNRPIFVDVEPTSLNIDPAKIEAAITAETTAVLAVHCYGQPCAVGPIQRIAEKYGLRVIYDAAHAFGVTDNAGSVVRHGDLAVLSFHATKVFSTCEGGAIICHDAQTKQRIDQLRNFGIVDEITVSHRGINAKMSEVHAAFGLLQLKYMHEVLRRRSQIDAFYRRELRSIDGIRCLPQERTVVSNAAYFPILVEKTYALTRDELYERLKQHNILTRRYFYPLISDHAMYRELPSADRATLSVAASAADTVLCLPIYPTLGEGDQARIIDVVRNA